MLTFLRKIRKSLIDSGSTRKYLLYGIGEIALVVIGILIALSINNWNQEKQRVKKEYEIMTNLAADFKNNLSSLKTAIDYSYLEWSNHLQRTTTYFGRKEDQLTNEMKAGIRSTMLVRTSFINGSLNSILNTEKLELIQNSKLKNMLTAYPATIEEFKSLEDNLEHYVLNVQRDVFRRYISLADEFPDDDPIKSNVVKSDYEGLMNNLYYQNVILGQNLQLGKLKKSAENLKLATEEIYNLLILDINKNPNHAVSKE